MCIYVRMKVNKINMESTVMTKGGKQTIKDYQLIRRDNLILGGIRTYDQVFPGHSLF